MLWNRVLQSLKFPNQCSGRATLRIQKTPDLHSWKKIGTMNTALGKEFTLYESPDGTKIAQVDKDMLIHMIISDGKPVYMDPRVMDALKRVAEIRRHLNKVSEKTER